MATGGPGVASPHATRGSSTPPAASIGDVSEAHLGVEDAPFESIKIPPGRLSGHQALVVELLYRRDLEVADAARIMDVDPQTVRSTHHKALTKLRAHFQSEKM